MNRSYRMYSISSLFLDTRKSDFSFRVFLLLFLMVFNLSIFGAAEAAESSFNHDETSFPLDFVHARVNCESCHVQGVFRGTPTQCYGCHSTTGRIQASAASPAHIQTTEECAFCHQQGGWTSVPKVDHFAVKGSCQSCHNSAIAKGKNIEHIESSENCDDCHRTVTWQDSQLPAELICWRFLPSAITPS